MALELPDAFQALQDLSLLGQGSHTQVYAAQWQGQAVILKCLELGAHKDWKSLQLFEREARALAHLNHPRIPRFLDFQADQQRYFLLTERSPGEPLSELLAQKYVFREAEVLNIASQALQILAYLHAFQPPLVHRDLKPSNLIWEQAKQNLYLIDFGGAQERLHALGSGGSTVVGTFGYMAPEQFVGRTLPQSDLYSLGATLIHLLTGRAPSQLTKKNSPTLQFQSYILCSVAFSRWLEKMVQPAAEARFSSALKALDALEKGCTLPEVPFLRLPHQAVQRSLPEVALESLSIQNVPAEIELPELEGYRWIRDLARGGQQRVWLAEHQGQELVVKSFSLSSAQDWKSLEMFEREIQTLKQIKHPRIPAFVADFENKEQGVWHLVFEYIPAFNLEQKIQSGWRPTEKDLWQIAEQALLLLSELQSFQPPLLHRDIKPSNWLLSDAGALYLIDFGTVQEPFRPLGAGGSTVVGTYGYMAPEQFSGQAWPASDLYALGITLIRLLTRRLPSELPHEGLRIEFAELASCSQALKDFLYELVEPDLKKRLPNARRALERLKALQETQLQGPVVSTGSVQDPVLKKQSTFLAPDMPLKLLYCKQKLNWGVLWGPIVLSRKQGIAMLLLLLSWTLIFDETVLIFLTLILLGCAKVYSSLAEEWQALGPALQLKDATGQLHDARLGHTLHFQSEELVIQYHYPEALRVQEPVKYQGIEWSLLQTCQLESFSVEGHSEFTVWGLRLEIAERSDAARTLYLPLSQQRQQIEQLCSQILVLQQACLKSIPSAKKE